MSSTTPELTQAYLDETNTTALLTTCIFFLILDTFVVVLRLYSRYYHKASFGWDDFLMGAGWLTCIGLCIDGIRFGVGTRFEKVLTTSPEQIPHWGWNGFYVIPILYCFAVSFPKMSVLVLYLRIFIDRFSKICCWALLGVISLTCIINVFTLGFQCNVPEAAWELTLPGRHCTNIQAHLTYSGIPNIVTDIAMLILPIPVVRKLQMAKHVKIGIVFTFLVASAGLITAVIRFVQFFLNTYASDPTYNAAPLITWVVVETSIYLISGCLLACRPVLGKFISSHHITSIYSWLRRTASRNHTGLSSEPGSTSHQTALPVGAQAGSSEEALYSQREYYRLTASTPGKIYVQTEFNVKSSELSV